MANGKRVPWTPPEYSEGRALVGGTAVFARVGAPVADLQPRPLPGRFPVSRSLFMELLRRDFNHMDAHGGPMGPPKFWGLVDDRA